MGLGLGLGLGVGAGFEGAREHRPAVHALAVRTAPLAEHRGPRDRLGPGLAGQHLLRARGRLRVRARLEPEP